MGKKLHLISNAHLDPVWQWDWEEGAAEAISTYRTAAKLMDDFDGYIFCHNEAQLYMWVKEYAPELFAKIQQKVKEGKWHIMGGWYNQPDCNMPSGEAFVRNILFGRRYFKENFDVAPTTAINFDPFGHTRGLVQILKKSGYDSYLFFRPDDHEACPLPQGAFTWEGYDGSQVTGLRSEWYGSKLGKATDKVNWVLEFAPEDTPYVCLWGVGNHGGGPSRKDVADLQEMIKEKAAEGITLVHSTPEALFTDVTKPGLYVHAKDLNPRFTGCYTSLIAIKQLYRRLENSLFAVEKMCAHAAQLGMEYPKEELLKAEQDMLTAQFHDTLPGTSVQPVESSSIRALNHGLEILTRLRARAFFKLSENFSHPKDDELPIFAYNPHPYEAKGVYTVELSMWDNYPDKIYCKPTVYQNGKALPTQTEKEEMNIPIQWRKRIVFEATLAPYSMNYFTCKIEDMDAKPVPQLKEANGLFTFNNGEMEVVISAATGHVERFSVFPGGQKGKNILKDAFKIQAMQDTEDPWSFYQLGWETKVGEFELLSPEAGSRFSAVDKVIPSVRIIEDGDARTVIEAVFGYNNSFAVVRYLLPKAGKAFDVNVRIINTEKKTMYKMHLPAAFAGGVPEGEVAFGRETLTTCGRDNISQRYVTLANDNVGFAVANDTTYGVGCANDTVSISLMRSTAYTAHPWEDREIMPQDRFSPYAEQGERLYNFRITGGAAEDVKAAAYYNAVQLNQPPYLLSFYSDGNGEIVPSLLSLSVTDEKGNSLPHGTVELTAFKVAEKTQGYTARLFNHLATPVICKISSQIFGIEKEINLQGLEVATLSVNNGECTPIHMMEGIV